MSYYSIADKLKNILLNVKNNGTRLAEVYDTQVPTPVWGYPYATISNAEATEKSLDTALNATLYRFTIRAVNVNEDKETGEATMRRLADEVMAEMRKRENLTLGGTVDSFLPYTLTWGWEATTGEVPARFFEIKLDMLKSYSIDT